jgi:DNA-binding IclR family transcriptional regulator
LNLYQGALEIAMTSKKIGYSKQVKKSKQGSRSAGLRRGLQVLCLYSDTHSEWGITEISKVFGIGKSLIHRTVKTLEDMGFLRKNPLNQKYTLGLRTFEVGSVALRQISLIPMARFHLEKLAQETNTTVSVRMLDGQGHITVLCYESPNDNNGRSQAGIRRPWNFGAAGKLFCAFRPLEELNKMIQESGLHQYTEKTITRESDFLKEMSRIRQQGYGVSDGEYIPWSFSVAAPIFNPEGNLVASIVSGTPREGLSARQKNKIVAAVVRSASNISQELLREVGNNLAHPEINNI